MPSPEVNATPSAYSVPPRYKARLLDGRRLNLGSASIAALLGWSVWLRVACRCPIILQHVWQVKPVLTSFHTSTLLLILLGWECDE